MDRAQAEVMGQFLAAVVFIGLIVGTFVAGRWIETTFGKWALAVPLLALGGFVAYGVIQGELEKRAKEES